MLIYFSYMRRKDQNHDYKIEPRHDKTNKVVVRPAKTDTPEETLGP